jgi:hypothetical protein
MRVLGDDRISVFMGCAGMGQFHGLRKSQLLPLSQLAIVLRMCVANNLSRTRPIDFLRAPLERLRNCETGEFTIVESLLNVFATNVFQIHHGGREVLVAEPFLQFTNAADIALPG